MWESIFNSPRNLRNPVSLSNWYTANGDKSCTTSFWPIELGYFEYSAGIKIPWLNYCIKANSHQASAAASTLWIGLDATDADAWCEWHRYILYNRCNPSTSDATAAAADDLCE